jgi:hypothetical protein
MRRDKGRSDQGDHDGHHRVEDWFGGEEGMEERPRRYGPPPAQREWDVSREWMGGAHRLVMAYPQQDPFLPVVRLPGDEDERGEARGFRQGQRDVEQG